MRHRVGVGVGDGPVLEGVLGLGQVAQLAGGVGTGLGLGAARALLAGLPVGVVLGRIRGIRILIGEAADPAGLPGGGPGSDPLGEPEHLVELLAGRGGGVLVQEIDRTMSIEHQYVSYQC